MEQGKKPRGREKKVTAGTGLHKTENTASVGTGPVNNTGNYAARKEQNAAQTGASSFGRPSTGAFGRRPAQTQQRPATTQRPTAQRPSTTQRTYGTTSAGSQNNASQGWGSLLGALNSAAQQQNTQQSAQSPQSAQQRPAATRPAPAQRATTSTGSTGSTGTTGKSGCSSKLILILIAVVVIFFLSKTLFGGEETTVDTGYTGTPSSSSSSSSLSNDIFGMTGSNGTTATQSTANDYELDGSETSGNPGMTMGLSDLYSMFMGGSTASNYDFEGSLGSSSNSYFSTDTMPDITSFFGNSGSLWGNTSSGTSSSTATTTQSTTASSVVSTSNKVDTTVAKGSRAKYTKLKGKGNDVVTIMVYMCGTDLESQSGMGTSDLKEMVNATLNDKVNLIVYTGGCKRWKNSVVSSSVNQIYQIKNGKLLRLEENAGKAAMTKPETLASFIKYCGKNFPANRNMLIFWDHGGGSLSGYGYDEKYSSSGSMDLSGINTAIKNGGVKFDVIGFDACLMATVETGLMLSPYGDYMIASEESEPGVGWYYTNWLTKLAANTSMKTVELGKIIVDDFVDVCNQQCRGQATTLSITDLAELENTIPDALSKFSASTNKMIQNQYNTVSKARNGAREFAQSSRIDQVDLIHFAMNLGNEEGKTLAQALDGAVKYNRFSGGMTNAYGLSVYFPYRKTSGVSQAVKLYKAIGMDNEYIRCIQEFASMEVSGQAVSNGYSSYNSSYGSSYDSYGSYGSSSSLGGLFEGLMGGSNGYGSYSSSGDMMDLLGGLFGGGSFDFFGGRSLTAETAASYISENHLDATGLVWTRDNKGYGITLSDEQWSQVSDLTLNVLCDDGKGYLDLGTDNVFEIDGNTLRGAFDGTWLSIDGHPVAYYYLNTVESEDGEQYVITGYVPALLNGNQVRLILVFDNERPYGYIAGAQPVYTNGETQTIAKNLIEVGAGDKVVFLYDYYTRDHEYQQTMKLDNGITLGKEIEISNTPIGDDFAPVASYCFTDTYQVQYWTPAIP